MLATPQYQGQNLVEANSADAYHAEVEQILSDLKIARTLREDGSVQEFDYSRILRAFERVPDAFHLTLSTLRGPEGLSNPLIFEHPLEDGLRRCTTLLLPGHRLCSHPGIVHGGMLSTLMDETLAMAAFDLRKEAPGFTARLEVDFRAPVPTASPIIVETWQESVEGSKIWVRGRILSPEGEKPLVEAKALYIRPKKPTGHINLEEDQS